MVLLSARGVTLTKTKPDLISYLFRLSYSLQVGGPEQMTAQVAWAVDAATIVHAYLFIYLLYFLSIICISLYFIAFICTMTLRVKKGAHK